MYHFQSFCKCPPKKSQPVRIQYSAFYLCSQQWRTTQKATVQKCKTSHSQAQKACNVVELFSILHHERGYQFLMFYISQKKYVSFFCLLAWMGCDWQKVDLNILERKTEIREAAKTPPTLSHLGSSQCSRNEHIKSWLEHLSVSKGFQLDVWVLC